MGRTNSTAHVILLPFPSQGHINPMLQFAKRLASKGPKATLTTTHFIFSSIRAQSDPVQIKPISDGYDQVGFTPAVRLETYLTRFQDVGSKSLADLIKDETRFGNPVTCIVYDTFMSWGLDVAKRVGLPALAFSTQSCVVSAVYYYVNQGLAEVPRVRSSVSVAGSVPLALSDFPSFALDDGSYPFLSGLSLEQFRLDKNGWVLFNSFDELEDKVITCLKRHWHARTIGPTVPRLPVGKNSEQQEHYTYGMNLLQAADHEKCKQWLDSKPPASVVYISFGSYGSLTHEQTTELADGLTASNKSFLWALRASEQQKLPRHFIEQLGNNKGLVVSWSLQLAVLAHESVGCFVTHCGWNSTLEALSLGVPMVAGPQWADQPTNAKCVEDVWRVGVRARADEEKGVVVGGEIERCIREVMDGERRGEVKRNAKKWRESAEAAVSEGGSSDENLTEFVGFVNAKARTETDEKLVEGGGH